MGFTGPSRRTDTSTWPNAITLNMHIWSHLHEPLHAAKNDANQGLLSAGLQWSEGSVAEFLSEVLDTLPPTHNLGELASLDFAWLAKIWNKSAGLCG